MTVKRALIVDDSKSARFALKRMLKELSLEVDTVESAADAIEYLQEHLPDVIFMDHMMPGMDGFEAVKRIKNNPQTAVIPIMMYTSKGGDVYLSQARALGAVGIIRKTIAPVELRSSLLELGLIEDIPHPSTLNTDVLAEGVSEQNSAEGSSSQQASGLDTYVKDLRKLMDDQTIELHRSMWLGIESVSNEIFNRLNSDLDEKIEKIQTAPQESTHLIPLQPRQTSLPLYALGILLGLSVIFNILLLTDNKQSESKTLADNVVVDQSPPVSSQQPTGMNENSGIYAPEKDNIEEDSFSKQQARKEFITWAHNRVIEYPYDELALNDNRLSNIEELVSKAIDAQYRGRIVLQTHVGLFCLNIDQMGNYKLAGGAFSITGCEFIGSYVQPSDEPSSHQSLSFVNYLSDTRLLNRQGINIEVTSLTRRVELSKYPLRSPQTLVEDWNKVAQANNRITVMLKPESTDLL